jgi:hypothetical protein
MNRTAFICLGLFTLWPAGCARDEALPRATLAPVAASPAPASPGVEIARPAGPDPGSAVIIEPVRNPKPVRGNRWRGFNLMGMYAIQWENTNRGFKENDFATIAELGFNYVRLPLDYRSYTSPTNWLGFDENSLKRLDAAVAWGQKHGVHVDICLHRAPGYCSHDGGGRIVKLPPEQDVQLWDDASAQRAFVGHWIMFARRYQKIGNEYLSFNLVNEPPDLDMHRYAAVMTRAIDAIRAITPDRLIVVDGLEMSRKPIVDPDFLALTNVIQSRHCYDFPRFANYDAIYEPGSERWPVPSWPPLLLTSRLWGSYHHAPNLDGPLVIEGNFPAGTRATLHVNQVSTRATLVVTADGAEILRQAFVPGPTDAEAKIIQWVEAWKIHQNIYDKDYTATVPGDATRLTFQIVGTNTDWLSFDALTLQSGATKATMVPVYGDRIPPATYRWDSGVVTLVSCPSGAEKFYDLNRYLDDWKALKARGVRVMIGEFNQSNKTPHDSALRYYEFLLKSARDAGFDWASWDFDFPGGGGPFNSQRGDVAYEDYRGYKLDRQMVELFQRY